MKAAEQVRKRLYDSIIEHDKAKGAPGSQAFWMSKINAGVSSFTSDVDKIEASSLQQAFGPSV